MPKPGTAERIRQRAEELAASGEYASFAEVVGALDDEGFRGASAPFESREFREHVNGLCDEARKEKWLPLSARGIPGQR